ncbi:MAG: nuclear transport factor 2 family protein [Pseudomonadota bacterium]
MSSSQASDTSAALTSADLDAIRRACEALSIAYARAVDFRDYDTVPELFTEGGVLDTTEPVEGRAAIAARMLSRPDELRSRHVLTNIFIDVLSPTEARGISYLTLYRHIGPESLTGEPVPFEGPAAIGHYEDRFEKTDEGWRIQRRKLHFAFRRF